MPNLLNLTHTTLRIRHRALLSVVVRIRPRYRVGSILKGGQGQITTAE